MMFLVTASRQRVLCTLSLVSLLIITYTLQWMLSEVPIFQAYHARSIQGTTETGAPPSLNVAGNGLCQYWARVKQRKQNQEVKDILARLDRMMPSLTFTDIEATTSAKNSRATLLNPKDSYCVGDHLMVRLDLYDYLGKRKKYGGDFLRARIHSPHLKAGATGHIKDYGNGTYLVNFTLFWEGTVGVSILLIHPSEGVSALWAARKKGFDKIAFTGEFLNGTVVVPTPCGFNISGGAELCEYRDERDQEFFYCVKPKNVPCEAFVSLMSRNTPVSYLTDLEQRLLKRTKAGVEIPEHFGEIRVLSCNRNALTSREKCRTGLGSTPIPSGYALQNVWHPEFCSVSDFSTLDKIHACLKGKKIYLMGDSTLRQWIYCLTEKITTLKFFDHHDSGVFGTHVAMDPERSIFIQWKRHGHPFVTGKFYSIKDDRYITSEIDQLAGGKDTAVVITLGQHFRPFPMDLFVRRLLNVRRAIQHLFLRSPDTKVIIRAENVREMNAKAERFGDIHGYPQNLVMKDVFKNLSVGFIDAWDMSIAYAVNDVHPPPHVVFNQIIMFLTYIWTNSMPSERCSTGMSSPPFPSGFMWHDQWYTVFCRLPSLGTLDQINTCLENKLVYFLGDSTVQQWMKYLTNTVTTLNVFDTHEMGNLLAVDMARNIQLQWKMHGHPIVTRSAYMMKEHSYIAREIDSLAGDRDTDVVISLGQHFRPFPIKLFIRRVLNIRAAVQRLLLRSPDTKVIIKAENTRDILTNPEQFSDFHGYTQYLTVRHVFRDLKVGIVDAWDMTVANATANTHPPELITRNQVNMFLSYIC